MKFFFIAFILSFTMEAFSSNNKLISKNETTKNDYSNSKITPVLVNENELSEESLYLSEESTPTFEEEVSIDGDSEEDE